MSENVPPVPGVPACNGSPAPEEGLPLAGSITDGIIGAAGTVPCMEAGAQPGALLAKGNAEESENSLAEDMEHGDCDGGEQCGGNVRCSLFFEYLGRKVSIFCAALEERDVLCALLRAPELQLRVTVTRSN